MNRQIETTLFSLIPSYSDALPETLVQTASSLLSQSFHRASTLKAEEEIARQYACANIACDRLKITLDLPPIQVRPPVPPRIYKRLYDHLNNVLSNSTAGGRSSLGRVRTPSARLRDRGSSPASQTRRLPSRQTPTKESSLAQFRPKKQNEAMTPSKSRTHSGVASSDDVLAPLVRPTVRFMCAESGNEKAIPTILAGFDYIFLPGGRKTDDEWVNQNVASLLAALYFFVIVRMQSPMQDETVDRAMYTPLRKEILATFAKACKDVVPKGGGDDQSWTVPKTKDFDAAVTKINEEGWLQGDWYSQLDDLMGPKHDDEEANFDAEADLASQLQARRADTMLLDKYDYLNEGRQADYAIWKEKIMLRISELSAVSGNAMELDSQ